MDIRMPVMNGLEATRSCTSGPDPPPVIVLTTFDADDHVVGAVAAGADGFLLKDTPPAEIVDAIRRVAAGDADALAVGDPHPVLAAPPGPGRRPRRPRPRTGSTSSPSASARSRSASGAA